MSEVKHEGGETQRGQYIVLEGADGCGKDTQVEELQGWAEQEYGLETTVIREPYDDPIIGPFIAELLTSEDENRNFDNLDNWQQALLMNAARRGIMNKVSEYIDHGVTVFSSRCYVSTGVYQGWAAEELIEISGFTDAIRSTMDTLNDVGTAQPDGSWVRPDWLFILDVDPEVAKQRMPNKKLDALERRPAKVQRMVTKGYVREASRLRNPKPILIDANPNEQEVSSEIKQYLSQPLGELAMKAAEQLNTPDER